MCTVQCWAYLGGRTHKIIPAYRPTASINSIINGPLQLTQRSRNVRDCSSLSRPGMSCLDLWHSSAVTSCSGRSPIPFSMYTSMAFVVYMAPSVPVRPFYWQRCIDGEAPESSRAEHSLLLLFFFIPSFPLLSLSSITPANDVISPVVK